MGDPPYTHENRAELEAVWSDVWALIWLYPLSHSVFASLAVLFQTRFVGHAFYALFALITFAWAISYARRLALNNIYSIPNTILFAAILATVAATHPFVIVDPTKSFWPSLHWTGSDGALFIWPAQSTNWLHAGNLLYSAAIAVTLVVTTIAIVSFAIYTIHAVVVDLKDKDTNRNILSQAGPVDATALKRQMVKLADEVATLKKAQSKIIDEVEKAGSLQHRIAQLEKIKTPAQRQGASQDEPSKFDSTNPLAAFKGL